MKFLGAYKTTEIKDLFPSIRLDLSSTNIKETILLLAPNAVYSQQESIAQVLNRHSRLILAAAEYNVQEVKPSMWAAKKETTYQKITTNINIKTLRSKSSNLKPQPHLINHEYGVP